MARRLRSAILFSTLSLVVGLDLSMAGSVDEPSVTEQPQYGALEADTACFIEMPVFRGGRPMHDRSFESEAGNVTMASTSPERVIWVDVQEGPEASLERVTVGASSPTLAPQVTIEVSEEPGNDITQSPTPPTAPPRPGGSLTVVIRSSRLVPTSEIPSPLEPGGCEVHPAGFEPHGCFHDHLLSNVTRPLPTFGLRDTDQNP